MSYFHKTKIYILTFNHPQHLYFSFFTKIALLNVAHYFNIYQYTKF
jgi:hypothetical protein